MGLTHLIDTITNMHFGVCQLSKEWFDNVAKGEKDSNFFTYSSFACPKMHDGVNRSMHRGVLCGPFWNRRKVNFVSLMLKEYPTPFHSFYKIFTF